MFNTNFARKVKNFIVCNIFIFNQQNDFQKFQLFYFSVVSSSQVSVSEDIVKILSHF